MKSPGSIPRLEVARAAPRLPAALRRRLASFQPVNGLIWLLLPLSVLIVWGPPRLRFSPRALDASLEEPLSLDAGALFEVATWLVTAAVVILLVVRHLLLHTDLVASIARHKSMCWYVAFGVLALASTVYSTAPLYTLYFASQVLVGLFALVLLLRSRRSTDLGLRIFFYVAMAQVVAIGLLYLISPDLAGSSSTSTGAGYRLNGGVLRDYGKSAIYAGILMVCLARTAGTRWRRRLALLGYLATWGMVLAAKTRSTTFAATVVAIMVLVTDPRPRVRRYALLIGCGAVLLAVTFGLTDAFFGLTTREGEGLTTGTGRTTALQYLFDQWRRSPIWGLGFASGARTVLMEFVMETRLNIGAAHDVLSKVLIDLGLAGVVTLGFAFSFTWWRVIVAWRRTRHDEKLFVPVLQIACIMTTLTMHSFVSASIGGPYMPFVVAITALWALDEERLRARRRFQSA